MSAQEHYLIGVTGGSGSGKTYFLQHLLENFNREQVCLISQDNYYHEISRQPKDEEGWVNFDLPSSIDFEKFTGDIKKLMDGQTVELTEYTFNNPNAKSSNIVLHPAPVIVVEGIFVFHHAPIADFLNLKIFIDAPDYLKLKRRIIRDNSERGLGLDEVLYQYENHVAPTFSQFILPYKDAADIVIPNQTHMNNALEVIIGFIKNRLFG